jgi:hypothetical protein
LLLKMEEIVVQLSDEARIDVLIELGRLADVCKAADSSMVSATVPWNTGATASGR